MFTAGGELDVSKIPRVVWFIIIGVGGGLVIMYGLAYVVALIIFYMAWLAIIGLIFLVLNRIDGAVDNRGV